MRKESQAGPPGSGLARLGLLERASAGALTAWRLLDALEEAIAVYKHHEDGMKDDDGRRMGDAVKDRERNNAMCLDSGRRKTMKRGEVSR